MDIRCTTCNKDVSPLELYDGCWSCPICRKPLMTHQNSFAVTADNEELFLQSELLFATWLMATDASTPFSTVEKAVDLCRKSAKLGNPKAAARLAFFYDKGYIGQNYSEIMRCKIAYANYSALCFSGISAVEVEAGIPPIRWAELCQKTAHAMLCMLASAPAELQESDTFGLRANLERVRHELGIEIDLSTYPTGEYKISLAENLFNTLISCVDKHRAPLFGTFRIKGAELREVFARPMPGKEDKIPQALYWLATNKKVLITYIKEEQISDSDARFTRLSTRNSWESAFSDIEDEEIIWIFFFNHNGGHKYLSAKKREKVEKTIYGRTGTDLLKMLLQNCTYKYYTFYDDDIYQFMKQGNEADATRALVDKVCNGGSDA